MAGDPSAIEAFFADEDEFEEEVDTDELRSAIIAELQRRHS